MQGAELDADPVIPLRTATGPCRCRQGPDRIRVAVPVTLRIGRSSCALAQHVVGKAKPCLLPTRGVGMVHRLCNILPEHKLASHQLDRTQGRSHHGMGAQAPHQAATRLRFVGIGQKVLGQGDGSARQPCQNLVAGLGKVSPPELVSRERDCCVHIRHPQQRLRQAHQSQALGTGDRVLAQQALHRPQRSWLGAHRLHPRRRRQRCSRPIQRAVQMLQSVRDDVGLRLVGRGQDLIVWHAFSPLAQGWMDSQ